MLKYCEMYTAPCLGLRFLADPIVAGEWPQKLQGSANNQKYVYKAVKGQDESRQYKILKCTPNVHKMSFTHARAHTLLNAKCQAHSNSFCTRQHAVSAHMLSQFRPSVCPSVCLSV